MKTRKIVLMLASCSLFLHENCVKSPADSKGLSLSGSVKLEGQSDHSGTVADFGLRILDFGLQMGRDVKNRQGWSRMVKEFHTVGIPISQATEFDHRLAKPIYQTQTKADGSYKMEGVAEGSYNLVAVRQGYGWKYLYEVEATKEAKTVAEENIVLYPELEVSGVISQYTVWPSEHHIIVKGDVVVPEGETLIIDRGAVIRFDGFYELRIEGNLQVNGEEKNMVTFTSNFSEMNAGDWKAIKIKRTTSEAQIRWARVEFAENGVEGIGGRIDVHKSRFKQIANAGVLVANECQSDVLENTFSHSAIGIRAEGNAKALSQHNLIYECKKNSAGIGINVNNSDVTATDNIIARGDIAVKIEYKIGIEIAYNYVAYCGIGISMLNANPIIKKNTLADCSKAIIYNGNWSYPLITMNNILASNDQKAVWAPGSTNGDIDARNNYWGTQDIAVVQRKISDQRVDVAGNKTTCKINLNPIALQLYDDAKPR